MTLTVLFTCLCHSAVVRLRSYSSSTSERLVGWWCLPCRASNTAVASAPIVSRLGITISGRIYDIGSPCSESCHDLGTTSGAARGWRRHANTSAGNELTLTSDIGCSIALFGRNMTDILIGATTNVWDQKGFSAVVGRRKHAPPNSAVQEILQKPEGLQKKQRTMPNDGGVVTNPEAFFCGCTANVVSLYFPNWSLKSTVQMPSLVANNNKDEDFS
jgi:hypothetical protein